ncbi:DUF2059 domain-containing protein [Roseibacterium beibuensis]|uniref:DUF2059 domain-containing protein n=1 Tax=[Roseibacterium] beibuensis TaxID=1193142 RepID=UPI00217E3346|nr:DUF2059 domain-containing protein [Roseibacterium beibuensis]MCS6624774.1 DUF2059 domain-containing protein [Roseibacterium beibuensis]
MRVIAIIAAVLVVTAGPAWAQTAPDADRQAQLDRAERYLALAQGAGVTKLVRQQLEDFYGDGSMPSDQRDWLTENMTVIYEDVLELALADVRDDVADSFTAPELDALIAFYDTPLGRSIMNKEAEINMALQEAMMPHLMTRMAAVGEKFCQRFDCSDMGGAAAKRGS